MLWKKAMLLGLVGLVIGSIIGVCLMLAGSATLQEALPHILLGGIYGAVAMGSSVVYDIEKWSIARATATHFLLVFSLYFLLVISMGWFRLDDPVFWIVVAAMVVAYVCIWLFQYLSYRRQIREMNENLKNGSPEKTRINRLNMKNDRSARKMFFRAFSMLYSVRKRLEKLQERRIHPWITKTDSCDFHDFCWRDGCLGPAGE